MPFSTTSSLEGVWVHRHRHFVAFFNEPQFLIDCSASHMVWLPSPGKESAQTHDVAAAPPPDHHLQRHGRVAWCVHEQQLHFHPDSEAGLAPECFGGFLKVIRELQIGNDGFKSAVILLLKANVFGCLCS